MFAAPTVLVRGSEGVGTPVVLFGAKPGKVYQPLRVAVTGTTISPGIFETLWALGREETLAMQEWFVRERTEPPVVGVEFAGVETALPGPGADRKSCTLRHIGGRRARRVNGSGAIRNADCGTPDGRKPWTTSSGRNLPSRN